MSALESSIEARRAELSDRVLSEMYEDPFWSERFGERGRRFAAQDSDHHVTYLLAALSNKDGAVFGRYAAWLRSVLTTRGMCTRHLRENLQRLGRAIAEQIPDAQPALDVLEAGCAALDYVGPAARALEARGAELAAQMGAELPQSEPSWARERPTGSRGEHDIRQLLSYLADAIEFARPGSFAAHALWMQSAAARHGAPERHMPALLEALRRALARPSASAGLASAAEEPLRQALAALGSAPSEPAREGGA